MKPEFNNQGVSVQTFDEILAEIAQSYQAIYGADIDLSQNTPDGQRIAIEARAQLDMQVYLSSIYNVLDPDLSDSELLRKVIKICGITPFAATKTTINVDVVAASTVTLTAGFEIKGADSWALVNTITINAGTTSVSFAAVEFGAIKPDPSSINEVVTNEPLVLSVNNPDSGSIGVEAETDEAIRLRRRLSVEKPASSSAGSLLARLLDISSVTNVAVYENRTAATVGALPAHSIWCVVEGGNDSDIAKTLALNTAGAALKGAVLNSYIEEIKYSAGGGIFYKHDNMNFDRPTYSDLNITLTARKINPDVVVDEDAIKNALSAVEYRIGDASDASRLYSEIYKLGFPYSVDSMQINGVDRVDGVDGQIFRISQSNITITITL